MTQLNFRPQPVWLHNSLTGDVNMTQWFERYVQIEALCRSYCHVCYGAQFIFYYCFIISFRIKIRTQTSYIPS